MSAVLKINESRTKRLALLTWALVAMVCDAHAATGTSYAPRALCTSSGQRLAQTAEEMFTASFSLPQKFYTSPQEIAEMLMLFQRSDKFREHFSNCIESRRVDCDEMVQTVHANCLAQNKSVASGDSQTAGVRE